MSSKKRLEELNLEQDLVTTPEDIAALRRTYTQTPMDLEHYLRTLSRLEFPENARHRRKTHKGYEPFSL